MKNTYWHQKFLPRYIIIGFCLFMLLSLFIVEFFLSDKQQPYFKDKYAASQLTLKVFKSLKKVREDLGIKINPSFDPIGLGLIGDKSSPITTDPGILYAKRTSINPNIAALFVQWFGDASLKKGDVVAVAMTGSFPAINVALLSSMKVMGLKPLLIFSAGASNYGANIPGFSWVDMYSHLVKQGYFNNKPLAVSLGGSRDKGYGMNAEGRHILREAIKKAGYRFLKVRGTEDSIQQRLALYRTASRGKPIRAYINIGGGIASIGLKRIKQSLSKIPPKSLRSELTTTLPLHLTAVNSVAVSFLKQGIQVINLKNVSLTLAQKYNFPYKPARLARVGSGDIFVRPSYHRIISICVLLIDIIVLIVLTWVSGKYLITYKVK